MNIENLKMFCRVVEEGSVNQAARLSFVSQPAVTKQIRQLENYYGTALFDRSNGRLSLTKAGKALLPYAKEMIVCIKRSEEVVQHIVHKKDSTLNIGASLTIGEYLLPGLLGDFQRKNKNIRFNLSISNTPSIIAKLKNRDIDIALVEGIVTEKDFQIEKFAEDELILVIPSNHHWKDKYEIDMEELTEEKMIWREKDAGVRSIIENVFSVNNVLDKIKSYMELGSTQAIKSAIEAELGVGILPKLTVTKELRIGTLKQLHISGISIKRNLWIVKTTSRFPIENLELFENFLKRKTL
ncbi:LysR family transcriptional regulator [Brevibacillus sp. NRS-1366]|uniref:LysR family transcriptional regulator n=1 Tax=Brevibacillus sp. NRS-1366 TaxID=3233899 RepID=UPI003D22E58D